MQGRRDLPLSSAGRRGVGEWRLPFDPIGHRIFASPLRRCRETAAALGLGDALLDQRLIEMDWGDWEGHTAAELRQQTPGLKSAEALGLDMRPPNGESPRDVQTRLRPWLHEQARGRQPTVAITHKGVIRAVYAMATGWDMRGTPPDDLDWDAAAHSFKLGGTGVPQCQRLNMSLHRAGG